LQIEWLFRVEEQDCLIRVISDARDIIFVIFKFA